jgi:hypothetical protein
LGGLKDRVGVWLKRKERRRLQFTKGLHFEVAVFIDPMNNTATNNVRSPRVVSSISNYNVNTVKAMKAEKNVDIKVSWQRTTLLGEGQSPEEAARVCAIGIASI